MNINDNFASNPCLALDGSALYIGGYTNLYAVSTATGSTIWTIPIDSPITSTLTLDVTGTLYALPQSGAVFAYDSMSGQQLWNYTLPQQWSGKALGVGIQGNLVVVANAAVLSLSPK